MAGCASKLPSHLKGIAPEKPYGTRAKCIQKLRELVADVDAITSDIEVKRCETQRKTVNNLIAHYESEARWESNLELVARVRELETELAAQQAGQGLVHTTRDSGFGETPGKITH